ncbi:type III secretion inner membrane ring lipoprotein SctJ [Pseudomonas sp. CDFA 602]|uniref:type III secretion system inner membrane ring lipoprotein SctJ n=1 Tax=Pseudomonas californiensis TaxID=2829823 RepID=UPI001E5F25AE|nr:type III secretion inner membrane ring lipoprotein SctJ [Pseudomonas californiensis]MCD5993884.1 type III secretion inner membrane ring lipoprotein SctJ [Pseudomonas californiensis]MCD5999613.1 type III secretion inner membrane ring lipoprotein SctJ [Pseudomonas californiensis]
MKFLSAGLLLCILMLGGCSNETDLFTGMSEQDSNEVVARLADQHIDARKRMEKSGVVVTVATSDMNRAVRVLDAAGLPRQSRTSLGEIFKKEGVISTPLEERARYIYALSQELEATLSQIDGVIVARVHVVLPERIAPGEPVQPASAAVFIKHSSILDPDSVRGRIQQMVASSIPGMSGQSADSKKFSIVFVPATEFQETTEWVSFGPFKLDSANLPFWNLMLWLVPVAIAVLLLIVTLLLRGDWRAAVLRRIGLGGRGRSNLPART